MALARSLVKVANRAVSLRCSTAWYQAAQDPPVGRLGLARGPMFATILAGDVLFAAANALIAAVA